MDTLCQNRQIESTYKLRLLKLIPLGCMHARAWNQSRAYWNSKLSNELVKESDLGQQASGKSS